MSVFSSFGKYVARGIAFDDYANKLMGVGEAGQERFVADVRAGASVDTLLKDLEASPWAAGHYGGTGLTNAAAQVFPGQGGVSADASAASGFKAGTGATLTSSSLGVVGDALKNIVGKPACAHSAA